MMRKFYKKKAGRRGAILVTVVFVLAFAVIFIAAAMVLTQATRKRVYTEAESNQARLTVTSVAESWYRAVQMCEFSDADLLDLCSAKTTLRVYASATADKVPGLENEGATGTSTDNYTSVILYRVPNSAGATKDEDFTYYADFSTHLDGQVENVRATLTYTPPISDKKGAPFSTQIDLNNKFKQNNLSIIGKGKDDLDNIFLVRKGGKNENSSFSTYATMVYCDGDVAFKDDEFFSKDIVFLKGARLANLNDSTNFKGNVENLFFFGDNDESISTGTKGNFGPSGLNFYLCKRSVGDSSWVEGANVVYINADGTLKNTNKAVFADKATNDAFVKKVKKYASYNTSYKSGGTNNFPTTDEFISSSSKLGITKTPPASVTGQSFASFLVGDDDHPAQAYQKNGGKYVTAGTYKFTSDGSDTGEKHPGLGDKEPYVLVLDGSKKYKFWFVGTFNLYNVVFIIDKPTPANPALFLLAKNTTLKWPCSDNGKVGGNGIFAVQGRDHDNAEEAYNFIKTTLNANLGGPKDLENTGKGYSKFYNGTNEPCAMVIGMGKNTFQICKNAVLEAFVGLFNESYGDSAQSKFLFKNGDNGVFYGRLMTDGYDDEDGGKIAMPACPGSSNMDAPDPDMKKLVTCFSLKSMVYYYGFETGKGG
ncbi:MAG: hypothetical protein J5623_07205 [Clostridiales bacterium]|nr:hypothetical protein [Clostridiales bacterium]